MGFMDGWDWKGFHRGIFLFHGQLLDGMALYWNDMADILGSRAGIYLKRFETAGIQGGDAAAWHSLFILEWQRQSADSLS